MLALEKKKKKPIRLIKIRRKIGKKISVWVVIRVHLERVRPYHLFRACVCVKLALATIIFHSTLGFFSHFACDYTKNFNRDVFLFLINKKNLIFIFFNGFCFLFAVFVSKIFIYSCRE